MRMTANRGFSVALAASLLFAGHASAADQTCPSPSEITETEGSYGWDYTAKVGTDTWEGSNPEGRAGDAKTFKLIEVTLRSGKFVACDYAGDGKAGARLSLETSKKLTPVKASEWNDSTCEASTHECAFRVGS